LRRPAARLGCQPVQEWFPKTLDIQDMTSNERRESLLDSVSESRRRADRIRTISIRILTDANRGIPRRLFFQNVVTQLLEFSQCNRAEIWVKHSERHFSCVASRSGEVTFGTQPLPNGTGPEKTIDMPVLDRLCHELFQGRFDPSLPGFTAKGSFWTGDHSAPPAFESPASRSAVREGGRLESEFPSLALIPIIIEEQRLGLLLLENAEQNAFNAEEIRDFEDICATLGIALAHRRAQVALRERIKELTCLYGIAHQVARPEASLDEILQGIVDLLPPGWLYPEIAKARIVLNGHVFSTADFRVGLSSQTSDIVMHGAKVGFVQLTYLEERPELDEGPFLTEERSLINNVAREVALFYERYQTEEEKTLLQDQLRHADRLATIGQLAAGVAHELNEPLGNILGFAQLTQQTEGLPNPVSGDIAKIVGASLHAREIIKKLMMFARQLPPREEKISLNDIAGEGLYFFEARCAKAGIELVRRFDPDLPEIIADSGQLHQVLVNLVVNAIQAMPKGGTLTVETISERDQVMLSVEDTGLGMTAEVQKQIFIPFFTTKDVDEGTGLGLPVVHGIVTSHKGTIDVTSKADHGTCFEIRLPLKQGGTEEESQKNG